MNKQSLLILDRLINEKKKNRLKDLLKKVPEAAHEAGWFMAVPAFFNDALDIKKDLPKNPGWSQSGCFAFKEGDILYDTPKATELGVEWSEALKHINLCVEVKEAFFAGVGENSIRDSGSVTLFLHKPNAQRTKLIKAGTHKMSQDEFVRFLIVGPDEEFKEKIGKPTC